MLKPLETITVPVVVRGAIFTRMIGSVFYRIWQCDKCRRVMVDQAVTPDAALPDVVLGCCEKCRVCGGDAHLPSGGQTNVPMHYFALEHRKQARDSAEMETRRP